MAAAQLLHRAGGQVKVPTFLVPATQKVHVLHLLQQFCYALLRLAPDDKSLAACMAMPTFIVSLVCQTAC